MRKGQKEIVKEREGQREMLRQSESEGQRESARAKGRKRLSPKELKRRADRE